MGNLKEYSAYTSYTEASASISYPQVSYVDDKNKVFFTHSNYMVVTYNVTSTIESTRVLGENFNLSQVSTMLIDGKKIDSPFKEYTFNTTGIHKVRVIFKTSFTDATDILYDTPCYVDKYIDKVNLNQILTNKDDLINGGGPIPSYFIATYNVTSTTEPTQILHKDFNISQIEEMYIDDVKQDTITSAYTFSTIGVHTVQCYMKYQKLTTCKYMFGGCSDLVNIDLSHLDTSRVSSMFYMFLGCSGLTSIDMSANETSNVTDMGFMFMGCRGLTSLTMMHSVENLTFVSNMFNSVTTTGTFYYNGNYDYSEIIDNLPSTWTSQAL